MIRAPSILCGAFLLVMCCAAPLAAAANARATGRSVELIVARPPGVEEHAALRGGASGRAGEEGAGPHVRTQGHHHARRRGPRDDGIARRGCVDPGPRVHRFHRCRSRDAVPDRPTARPHPRPARDADPRLRRGRARERVVRHRTVRQRHPRRARHRCQPRGVPAQRRPSGTGAGGCEPAERPGAAAKRRRRRRRRAALGCCWRAATTAWLWGPAPTSMQGS